MASGGKSQQQANESYLKTLAEQDRVAKTAAVEKAATPDPLLEARRAHVTALDDWESGKSGPIDVRNMPGGGTRIALFNDAKQSMDAGRVGKGYGSLEDGTNPNYATSLNKENELSQNLAASGALENDVNTALQGKDAEMYGLANISNAQNMNVANLQQNAYDSDQAKWLSYLMRPKQQGFLKQLLLQGVSQTGQFATAAAMA